MTDERDALLREVDEELRRDQLQKLWERYNGLILAAAALIVAVVWGYKFLENRRISAAEAAGADFEAAVRLADGSKTDEAIAAFEKIASNGPHGYASLAKLHIAGAQAKAGKPAEALKSYEGLASDGSADQLLKNFAQLQAASLRMGEADFTEMQNRLNSLAATTSPFKVTASELLGFAAFKAGNYEEARKHLEPLLIDPNATQAIQERIKIVMSTIAASELAAGPGKTQPPADSAAKPADGAKEAVPAPAPASEMKPDTK